MLGVLTMRRERAPARRNAPARWKAPAVRALLAAAAVMLGLVWAGPSPALDAAGPRGQGGLFPELRERALAAMEGLREEIATLTALRDAQAALLAWNRETLRHGGTPRYVETPRSPESAKAGASLPALPAGLCSHPAIGPWCPLLPATFGAPNAPSGGDTPSGGNTPSGGSTEGGHDRD